MNKIILSDIIHYYNYKKDRSDGVQINIGTDAGRVLSGFLFVIYTAEATVLMDEIVDTHVNWKGRSLLYVDDTTNILSVTLGRR